MNQHKGLDIEKKLLLFSSAKTTPNSVNKIQSIPILIKVHLLNDSSGPLLQIPLKVGYISGVVYVNGQSVTNGIVTRLHMQVTANSEKAGHKYQSNVQIQVRIFVRQLPTSNQNKCRTAVEEEVVEVDSYSLTKSILPLGSATNSRTSLAIRRLCWTSNPIYSLLLLSQNPFLTLCSFHVTSWQLRCELLQLAAVCLSKKKMNKSYKNDTIHFYMSLSSSMIDGRVQIGDTALCIFCDKIR
ncbi:uncharacterized protein TRIADDRAFT_61539 [Trichoplax adhaerens]|uniref:Uncharacterized protein n=1 Tax=Trichoplax adhaerens TaxID=10228 RepID=B3SB98_TRIAD|nr:predicted protein [Trichoplax adhaerens]EDV19922.1 predicted protein [Trichoplax adhaerens]|eukprot:XP_002117512.1 predicted protein [Trichoplax adhaerens]